MERETGGGKEGRQEENQADAPTFLEKVRGVKMDGSAAKV